MFNPDIPAVNESPEIQVSPDRKEKLDKLVADLNCKAGYGVTRIGDRLTIRDTDRNGNLYSICLVILEVNLKRDDDIND